MMRYCEINNKAVDCSTVTVDYHSFGKALAPTYAKAYRLTIEFADAIESFSSYYQSFVENEAEDEGFEEHLEGEYLQLRETGYLSFERMLAEQPELLARLLCKHLASEFMGYLFRQAERTKKTVFVLQTLTHVEIDEGRIICKGESFELQLTYQ